MHAVLIQQKCVEAFRGKTSILAGLTKTKKTEIMDKARISIILCLKDKVSMESIREKTVKKI